MCLERILRNAGFAVVATVIAIATALSLAIEYEPVVNALAR